jgi:hypothetical protein
MNVRWADENARGLMKLVPAFEYRRARLCAGVRVGVGVWLLILTAILYGYDRGGWWTPLLLIAAAAHFFIAYRLLTASARMNSTDAK